MKGQRIVFVDERVVEIEDYEVEAPSGDQVLVKTTASLISAGTETTMLALPLDSPRALTDVPWPAYPGYSNVGEVVEVGRNVDGFVPGDRVLTMGIHSTYTMLDLGGDRPDYIEKVPESISDVSATFGILGSVAIHGFRNISTQIGDSCAVIGQGVVGQLVGQLARIGGCCPVIGVDLFSERLEFSRESGFDHVVDASSHDTEEAVMEITEGRGVDLGLEATRNPATLKTLLKIGALGGNIVIVGSLPGTVDISLWTELQHKELSIHGIWQPRAPIDGNHYYPWTQRRNRRVILDLIADGRLKVDHLVTHRPRIEDAAATYEMILRGGTDWMGIAFDWT